jgi:hypothetical protein
MDNTDRIYDLLQKQTEALHAQGVQMATVVQLQLDQKERLFGANGQPGIIKFLQDEIAENKETLETHTKQITLWRGGLAVMGVVWTTALAYGGVIIGRHR